MFTRTPTLASRNNLSRFSVLAKFCTMVAFIAQQARPQHTARRLNLAEERVLEYPKWGSLIYRYDYRSDAQWMQFMKGWRDLVEKYIHAQDYKEHASDLKTLGFKVIEDKSQLEEVTVEQVQTLFSQWVRSEEAAAEVKSIAQVSAIPDGE